MLTSDSFKAARRAALRGETDPQFSAVVRRDFIEPDATEPAGDGAGDQPSEPPTP
jgi:hypothetical protein